MSAPAWGAPLPFAGDGYLTWAQADDFAGVLAGAPAAGGWVPLLVERRGSWAALAQAVQAQRLPVRCQPDWPAQRSIAPVWAHVSAVPVLQALVQRIEFSQPVAEQPSPRSAPTVPLAWPGDAPPEVVVGVIDSGGAPLHRAFRWRDAPDAPTRLLSFWDQSRAAQGTLWRRPPAGYGRELDGPALQRLCQRATSPLQEHALYAGELDMPEQAQAAEQGWVDHANHVLDTLAGLPAPAGLPGVAKPAQPDAAARAALVLVAVPGGLPGQSTGAPSALQVLDGLHHIHRVARAHAPDALVVVNISLGLQAGPRDSSLLLVQAIDELMAADPRLLVVIAAGNAGRHAMAANGRVVGGQAASVRWRIRPEDPTDSFLEAWWPSQDGPSMAFSATPPGGEPSPWVEMGQQCEWALPGPAPGPALARLCVGEGRAWLALAPSLAPAEGEVPAGCWRLACRQLAGEASSAVPVWLMVQGDQPDLSAWSGVQVVQSYLESAQGLSLAAPDALNALCMGRYPITVGAGSMENQRAAWYSAPANLRAGHAGRVHLVAAADEATLTPGLMAAGVVSGQWVRMRGTSVAAPVAARHIVNAWASLRPPARASEWRKALGLAPRLRRSAQPVLRPDRPWAFGGLSAASAAS